MTHIQCLYWVNLTQPKFEKSGYTKVGQEYTTVSYQKGTTMADSKKNVFFIGGYSYTVDKSTPLCRREDFFHSATLYQSPNGRFFVVENDAADTITVKVLSKSDAKTFMDEHPAGIFTENYIRIFGQPKQG